MGCAISASAEPAQTQEEPRSQPQQPQQPSYSPVSLLYRHALEHIFCFGDLPELAAILAVNHAWSAAIDSMKPSSLMWQSRGALSLLAGSRVARHVDFISGSLSAADLHVLSSEPRLLHVTELRFNWLLDRGHCQAESSALSRASHLRVLEVHMDPQGFTATSRTQRRMATNLFIEAAACIHQLETLALQIQSHDQRIVLAPLTALQRLRSFSLCAHGPPFAALPSLDQIAAVRQMTSLEHFGHNFGDRNATLQLVLQDPTPRLNWKSALVSSGGPELVGLLRCLPDLDQLDVECMDGDVEFLLSFPRVTTLSLHPAAELQAEEVTQIVATLMRSPQITALHCDKLGFTAAQLADWRVLVELSPIATDHPPQHHPLSLSPSTLGGIDLVDHSNALS